MPVEFQLPDNMTFGSPTILMDGELNYKRFTPVAGESFSSGQSFRIKIDSSTDFLLPQKSYLKFNLKTTGGNATAGSCISALGATSVLERCVTSVSGIPVEDINHYNSYASSLYKRLPAEQQNFLKEVELLNNQSALTATSDQKTRGYNVCHAVRCAIFESDTPIPLMFIQSGIEIEFTLADYRKLLANAAGGSTDFTVSNVEFVCGMIKPTDSYVREFSNSFNAGREASIPMTITTNFRLQPSTSTAEHSIDIPVGFKKSLRSILGVRKLSSTVNSTSHDEFSLETLAGLKEYYFVIGSQRFPQQHTIKCQNDVASGAPDAEHLMQSIVSLDNTYPHFNAVSHAGANTGQYIYFNFASNRGWGTGVQVQDGRVTLNLTHNAAPAASELDIFCSIDGVLKLRNDRIDFTTVDF